MSEKLDVHRLAPKLDRLVDQASSSTGIDSELLIKQARTLLANARKAHVVRPQADEPDTDATDGAPRWHAVASRDLPTGEDITCWRTDGDVEASLHGTWSNGRLQILELIVDDAAWGMRMTPAGASYVSTGAAVEGPADRRYFERIKRGLRDERHRAAREVAARAWVCGRCSWVNEKGADGCAFCGPVDVPWESHARHTDRSAREPVESVGESVGPTHKLPVPEGYEEGGIPGLFGSLTLEFSGQEAAVEVARSLPSVEDAGVGVGVGAGAGDGVRGDVLLDGFDPDRNVSVVGAVIDACEQAGAGRQSLAEATALVEHLPAIVCRDVTATQAAHIQRKLEEAGASTRFQRSHD